MAETKEVKMLPVPPEVHKAIKKEAVDREITIQALVTEIWSFYKNKK